jgi:hypothetical protein
MDAPRREAVIATLTPPRLTKYLVATNNDPHRALRLYALNTRVSAEFLADLHYVEIALRNRFDEQLTLAFGASWFDHPGFRALLPQRSVDILQAARSKATKHLPAGAIVKPGKVIAELSFGFWLMLTNPPFEHTLWVPYLHKAFRPRRPPARSAFNATLEKLRLLRNRVAHHEPIFHVKLQEHHEVLANVCRLLCPATTALMLETSDVRRVIMSLTKYRSR